MKIWAQDRPRTTGITRHPTRENPGARQTKNHEITRDPTRKNPGARQQEHLNIPLQDKPSTADI